MTHRAKNKSRWMGAGFLVLTLACGGGAQLAPAANAKVAESAADVAYTQGADVTLAAKADAWPGSPRVAQKLTPIQIQIENSGTMPIRASLSDIRLVTPKEALVAREPESIEIEPQATTVGKTDAEFDSESGVYEFAPRDPAKSLLSRQIRTLSLPERAIASGESVKGFIYFDALPKDTQTATLEVTVRSDPSGPVQTLSIPFERNR